MNNEPMFVGTAIYQLVKKFIKAMIAWAKSGFLVVPYYIVWKRSLICKMCTEGVGHRCPVCGCFKKFIVRLATSHCSNWDEYIDSNKEDITFNNYEPKEN